MQLLRLPLLPTKLYDGLEDEFYSFTHYLPPPLALEVATEDFLGNYFLQLQTVLTSAVFEQLTHEGRFRLKPTWPSIYIGSDALPLSYCFKESWLLVAASGEYQPSRFKLYLDGAWQVVR